MSELGFRLNEPAEQEPRRMWLCDDPDKKGCREGMCYPLNWAEAGIGYYRVVCRCPNCDAITDDIYTYEEIELFDEELDQGTTEFMQVLGYWSLSHIDEEFDSYVDAIGESS